MITETTITDKDKDEARSRTDGLHLLVMSPESFVSHPLPPTGIVTLGRSAGCDVRVDDPMASREHARLHIAKEEGGFRLSIEDLGSANGTFVRDAAIAPGGESLIAPTEGVIIGSTVVMVLQNLESPGLRRLWSHAYFGARLEQECARAASASKTFALARLRFGRAVSWTKVLPVLARDLAGSHGVAVYGPGDYEILFSELPQSEVASVVERIVKAFGEISIDVRSAVAWYPRNGRTGDALMAAANVLLKLRPGIAPVETLSPPDSAGMRRVRAMATRAASSAINVMIRGETGVGKDVLARAIHRLSPRAQKPFLALNCAGLSETLLESELFGHAKGAFSGAFSSKIGLLEAADGGTVFLDEIGEMPKSVQARLLRVIEDREIRPVGTVHPRKVNVRFLAATNEDLERAAEEGRFRRDLHFRLNGMELAIPPLRDRTDEIPDLARIFVEEGCQEMGIRPAFQLTEDALQALLAHEWKGNIRELKNVIERSLVLSDGPEILAKHLDLGKAQSEPSDRLTAQGQPVVRISRLPRLGDPIKEAERQRIVDAMETCASNQTRAAELLGMPRRTFVSKLDYYQIPRPQKQSKRPPEVPGPGSGEDGDAEE